MNGHPSNIHTPNKNNSHIRYRFVLVFHNPPKSIVSDFAKKFKILKYFEIDFEYKTAEQAEHDSAQPYATYQDVQQSIQQRHCQPHPKQKRPSTGITLELFQRLVAENSRRLHF